MIKLTPYPHILLTTDKIAGADSINGQARAFVIVIEKDANNFEATYHHELEHVKQFWMTLGLHGLFYLLSKRYKLWAEVQAYKQSIKYGVPVDRAARGLANEEVYGFGIGVDEAIKLLS